MANESRLINANELAEQVDNLCADWNENWIGNDNQSFILHSDVSDLISDAPTVDAVEVTRCKKCQEYAPGVIRPYLGWCSVWDTTVRETGFCHHGKPRSEEKSKPAWPPQEEMEEPCED